MKIIKINKMDAIWYVFFICSFLLPPIFGVAHYILTAFILWMTITKIPFKVRREYRDCLIWFILFSVYVASSKIWAKSSTNNQKAIIIALFETTIVFYCVLRYVRDEQQLVRFAEIFANSMVVLAASYYITSPVNTWGTEAMGTWLNIWRNAAGYYFGFAAIMIIYIFFYKKREKQLIIKALFLMIAAIGTGSRKTFLLGAVLDIANKITAIPHFLTNVLLAQYIGVFVIGVTIGMIDKTGKCSLVDFFMIVVSAVHFGLKNGFQYTIYLVLITGIFMIIALNESVQIWKAPGFLHGMLTFLAAISYPLYLIHQNIGYIIIGQAQRKGIPSSISICTAILAAILLAYLLDKVDKQILNPLCKKMIDKE